MELSVLIGSVSTITANIILLMLVLLHNRTSATSKAFAFMSIAIIIWSVTNLLATTAEPRAELPLARLVLFFALPMQFSFFLFAHTFPSVKLRMRKVVLAIHGALIFNVMLLTITPYVFRDMIVRDTGGIPILGPLMPIFGGTILFYFLAAGWYAWKRFRTSPPETKKQLKLVVIGIVVMYALLIILSFATVVFFNNVSFVPYAPVFTLPFLFFSTFAIIRHQFLQIKVVSAEIFSALIIFTLLLDVFGTSSLLEAMPELLQLILVIIFSFFVLRGVLQEVRSREEIERLATELRVANVHLRELDNLKSDFLSFASHQLRSPITAVRGYASLLKEGMYGTPPPKMASAIERIFQASSALVFVVEDFLNISRIEQGKMKYDMSTVSLRDLVVATTEDLMPTIKTAGVTLRHDLNADDQYLIHGDYGKLKQVFTNIIDNACKYAAGQSLTIEITRTKHDKIRVSFTDTGIGISPEILPTLFEKYSRSRAVRGTHVSGTGLGLYIARVITAAHEGLLYAESAGEGKGATFIVILPALNEKALTNSTAKG